MRGVDTEIEWEETSFVKDLNIYLESGEEINESTIGYYTIQVADSGALYLQLSSESLSILDSISGTGEITDLYLGW